MAGSALLTAPLSTRSHDGEWVSVREDLPPEISLNEALSLLSRPKPPRFRAPTGTPQLVL